MLGEHMRTHIPLTSRIVITGSAKRDAEGPTKTSEDIEREVAEFLARGGKIQRLAIGESAYKVPEALLKARKSGAKSSASITCEQPPATGYMSPKDAAKALGVSVTVLYTWRAAGHGPASEKHGAYVRYQASVIGEYSKSDCERLRLARLRHVAIKERALKK